MTLKLRIQQASKDNYNEVLKFRRHLHTNPELSFEEYNTAEYIENQLQSWGYKTQRMAKTGVIAIAEGLNPDKKTIALRADIDALPIVEKNNTEYCSVNQGVMHACGHDVHTASLLGVAKMLKDLSSSFEGSIKLIFQPGEEKIPGGASLLIAEGVLQNPNVATIIGQHVMPLLPAGKVGFRKGMYMASADEIYITIKGKGGHGAHPHTLIDPVAIGAQVITALQQVVSRNAKPAIPSVLSIGKVIANGATNIVPDEVYMEGTFRTFDENWRNAAHGLIKNTVNGICNAMGASAKVEVRVGYPFLENDIEVTERAKQNAIDYLGEDNVTDLEIWPAGEDFAFYTRAIPGTFYRLGTRNESKNIVSNLHTPTFDIDEEALVTSIGLMTYLAIKELESK
jgi:amidohydrolase